MIERPQLGLGREHNDFGRGFYCTEDPELAKEWAATHDRDGIANRYELDTANLSVLRLDDPRWCVLHWISVLVRHRAFRIRNPIAARGLRYLADRFPVVVEGYERLLLELDEKGLYLSDAIREDIRDGDERLR